jgi:hypothetical protein
MAGGVGTILVPSVMRVALTVQQFMTQPFPLIIIVKSTLQQELGCCQFHNSKESEMGVLQWQQMQELNLYPDRILKLVPR